MRVEAKWVIACKADNMGSTPIRHSNATVV